MVCLGVACESYLHDAAEATRNAGKPAHLYLLTDHDPSGVAIAAHIEHRIRAFLPGVDAHVERIAVTEDQIARLNLPTRPTKPGDSRSRGWVGGSVELDAIPAGLLRALVREHIERHVDADALNRTLVIERLERESLADLVEGGWAA